MPLPLRLLVGGAIALILFLTSASVCGADGGSKDVAEAGGSITVLVLDGRSNNPLIGATVILSRPGTRELDLALLSNEKGLVRFEHLRPSWYQVDVKMPGYVRTRAKVEVKDTSDHRLRVRVAELPAVLPLNAGT